MIKNNSYIFFVKINHMTDIIPRSTNHREALWEVVILILGVFGGVFLILLGFSVGSLLMVVAGGILTLVLICYIMIKIIGSCDRL